MVQRPLLQLTRAQHVSHYSGQHARTVTRHRSQELRRGRQGAIRPFGGMFAGPYKRRHELARGVTVLVATPGRLNDLLEMRRADVSQVSFLVFDEADRMVRNQLIAWGNRRGMQGVLAN